MKGSKSSEKKVKIQKSSNLFINNRGLKANYDVRVNIRRKTNSTAILRCLLIFNLKAKMGNKTLQVSSSFFPPNKIAGKKKDT